MKAGTKANGQRRKWLSLESPGGTLSEKCVLNGTDFYRRDIVTPGGVHIYKDEWCSDCPRPGATKCPLCSKRTAGHKHDSRRQASRQLLYDPEARKETYDSDARAETHREVYDPAARAEKHLDNYDSAEQAKLYQV